MIEKIYSSLTRLSWPYLRLLPILRERHGKEIKMRLKERFGVSNKTRTSGRLIWIHAASNGEALSALPLIEQLSSLPTAPHILLTTMTVTAADLVEKRTNSSAVTHQFIPYDHKKWIANFHKKWAPDMVIWIESELWPNHLRHIKDNNIPAVLMNARLSERSLKRWGLATTYFKSLLSCFNQILAQTERDKNNLNQLGIDNVILKGNLKDYSPPLPYDDHALTDLKNCIGSRKTILFASTHAPEENIALNLHQILKRDFSDLLTIIVPRHPARGQGLAKHFNDNYAQLNIALRSLKMSPRPKTDIYIADTLGELGIFYEFCSIAFIGNSLKTNPGGGHNLLEPAWFNCAVVTGNNLHNFSVQAIEMPENNSCKIINNEEELYTTVKSLLEDDLLRNTLSKNAFQYVSKKQALGLDKIFKSIEPTCKMAGLL